MAYSDSFPAIRPSFQFSADAGRLDSRISYSRSTTGTYFGKNKHLSSENLLTHSNDVSSAYSKNGVTETGGQAAPDGGTNAYKLTEDSATGFHRIYYASPVLSSGSLTVSCYVKYIGRQWVYLRMRDAGANYRHVWFDVQNGTKGTEETNMTGSITASGGGYYKLTATVSSVHAASADVRIGGANADGNTQYTGSGADAFAVWGIQASTTGETVLNETSGQIHREYAPTLQTAAINAPRFEYSASDSASMGLLIEGSSTNLLNRSEEFDNAYWSKSTGGTSPAINLTITPNAGIAPSGELTADLVVPQSTGGNTVYYIAKTYSFTSGNTYTLSVFVKAAGMTQFTLAAGNTGTWAASAQFTLTGDGSASVSSGSAQIEKCGNGWFRLSITGTAGATTSTNLLLQCVSSGQNSFDGDDYSGILLWGAMFEQASHSSSYLKVEGSTVTRAADSASAVTADIGYTGGDVTVFVESTSSGGDFPGLIGLDDGGSVNCMRVFRNSGSATSTTDFQFNVNDSSGSNQVASVVSGSGAGTKFAMRLAENNAAFAFDGNSPTTDTSCVMPVTTTLDIGGGAGVSQINGHVKRVALYSEALSDTNLQALTS